MTKKSIDITKLILENGGDINKLNNVIKGIGIENTNLLITYGSKIEDSTTNMDVNILKEKILSKIETYQINKHLFTQEQQELFNTYAMLAQNDEDFQLLCQRSIDDAGMMIEFDFKI